MQQDAQPAQQSPAGRSANRLNMKRKNRTPEEGSKSIYLKALTEAIGTGGRKSPLTEGNVKSPSVTKCTVGTPTFQPETEDHARSSCASLKTEDRWSTPLILVDTKEEERVVETDTRVSRTTTEKPENEQ